MVCIGSVSFLSKFFRNSPKVSISLDLNQVEKNVWSYLDPNILQRLSADDRSQHSTSHEYEGALHWITLYVEVV